MENVSQTPNTSDVDKDVNSPDFYKIAKNGIESYKALLQKNLRIMNTLRLEAAELEAETAALYHMELWSDLEHMKENIDSDKK